jgi:2-phosphosulfolactate phosphatase
MSVAVSFVPLADAAPAEAVVVIDVLRAFTLVPWLYERGADRVLAVANREEALALRADVLPDALLAGEHGGRPYPDFDLGNSPSQVRALDLTGRTVVHRTSAGTQGLARTAGSKVVFAASFLTAAATTRHLRALAPASVTFVITGASLGRDGDEDLACAELIAARLGGDDPDPTSYLARVARSDAGRAFAPDGAAWAPPADLALACELDRFDQAFVAVPADGLSALEVTRSR